MQGMAIIRRKVCHNKLAIYVSAKQRLNTEWGILVSARRADTSILIQAYVSFYPHIAPDAIYMNLSATRASDTRLAEEPWPHSPCGARPRSAPPRSWRPRPLQEEARRGAAAAPPWPRRAAGPVPDVPEAAGGRAGFLPLLPGVLLHQQGELLRKGARRDRGGGGGWSRGPGTRGGWRPGSRRLRLAKWGARRW